MKRFLRFSSLSIVLLFGPLAFAWVILQEMTFLNWFLPVAAVIWLLLLALWYLVFGQAPLRSRLKRLGLGALAVLVLSFAGSKLLRYEGSSSGSSFPRFSWVWQAPGTAAPPEILAPGEIPDGATRDLTGLSVDLEDFLGPRRNGMWVELPFGTDWESTPPELLWRRPVGKAWSSFTVSGNKALTQQQSGNDESVTCFDLSTGTDLWQHFDRNTRLLLVREENSGAAMGGDGPRATPVIHEGRVFSVGATGIVNCLDLETGASLWSRNLIKELGGGIHRWGVANAPLILPREKAVLFAGPEKPGPTLIACDLKTGETIWTYEGGGSSYSSPRLMVLAGVEQIVSVNAEDVCGIDPTTGKALWKHSWPGKFPKVAQALAYGESGLLVTASYGTGSLLLDLATSEGSSSEGSSSGSFAVTQLWKSNYMKTKFSSAGILGDYAYGLDEGRLACIDMKTGNRVWKKEKFGFGQQLFFGDWLLVQAESGDVVLGRVSPEGFVEKGRIPALDSMTWNVPAVAGRILLVRNDREAACYLLPAAP